MAQGRATVPALTVAKHEGRAIVPALTVAKHEGRIGHGTRHEARNKRMKQQ